MPIKFFVAVAFFLLGASAVGAETYYVDATGGSNSNSGTSTAAAWQTLVKVNATAFSPGDSILFKRGETFSGNIVVGQSGSAGSPITFGAYGTGSKPVINASGSNHGIDIRTSKSYINIDGLNVINATLNQILLLSGVSNVSIANSDLVGGSNSGINMQGPGTFSNITVSTSTASNYTTVNGVGITLTNGTFSDISVNNFTASSTALAGFKTGSGTYSGITIADSTFDHSGAYGIRFDTTAIDDIEIRNTTANANTATGISMSGPKTSVVLSGVTANENGTNGFNVSALGTSSIAGLFVENSVFDSNVQGGFLIQATSSDIVISSSTASDNGVSGYAFERQADDLMFDGVVADNNGGSGIYFGAIHGSISSSTVQNSRFNGNVSNGMSYTGTGVRAIVRDTEASYNENDGFNVHDSWSEMVFENNLAESNGVDGIGPNGDGFSFHETSSGVIRNNVVRNNMKSAIAQVGNSSSTIYGNIFSHETTGSIPLLDVNDGGSHFIFNNVFYNPSQQGTAIRAIGSSTVSVRNNIISGFSEGMTRTGDAVFSEDHNLIYGVGTSNYSSVTAGANTLYSNPLFVAASNGDFRLASSSLAIDAGTDVGIDADAGGMSRYGSVDIGAHEYQPALYVGNDEIALNSTARIYGDEKFRHVGVVGSAEAADLSVEIPGSDRGDVLDVTIDVWSNSGTRYKRWTESSESSLTDTSHVVGDLEPRKRYEVKIDGAVDANMTGQQCFVGLCWADENGKISFTYTGTYSSHVFEVEEKVEVSTGSSSGRSGSSSSRRVAAVSVATPSPYAQTVLSLGDRGDDVLVLQRFLISHGYLSSGNDTGYYGPLTSQAFIEYSKSGVVSIPLNYSGMIFSQPLSKGSRGTQVSELQRVLALFPTIYPEGIASGYFGELTEAAVIRFQMERGVISSPQDEGAGIVGPKTRAVLNSLN